MMLPVVLHEYQRVGEGEAGGGKCVGEGGCVGCGGGGARAGVCYES